MVGYRGQLLIAVLGPVLATLRRILGKVIKYTYVLGPVLATLRRILGKVIKYTYVLGSVLATLRRVLGKVIRVPVHLVRLISIDITFLTEKVTTDKRYCFIVLVPVLALSALSW
jgi:hypothetical protein